MARYLYSELSNLIQARSLVSSKPDSDRHTETIDMLVREHMPSGSGFDSRRRARRRLVECKWCHTTASEAMGT